MAQTPRQVRLNVEPKLKMPRSWVIGWWLWAMFCAAAMAGIIIVAVHFIAKWW